MTQPENRAEGDVDKLVFSQFFADRPGSVFVDVGAARPDYLSVSALFRENGWRVISVEPNPVFAEMHRRLGHEIYEVACGADDKEGEEFMIVDSHGEVYEGGNVTYESFSALEIKKGYAELMSPDLDYSMTKIKVPVRRLDKLLDEAGVDGIDVLSIDTEGWELEVLHGLDGERYRPSVMILENWFRNPAYMRAARDRGYCLWKWLAPNQVFVTKELRASLPVGERMRMALPAEIRPRERMALPGGARPRLREFRERTRMAFGRLPWR